VHDDYERCKSPGNRYMATGSLAGGVPFPCKLSGYMTALLRENSHRVIKI